MEEAPTWWAKELEQRTGGRVKVTLYYNEALGKSFDGPKMLKSGVAEIGEFSHSQPNFPMLKIFHAPSVLSTNADEAKAQEAFWLLYNKGMLKELEDFRPLWWQPTGTFNPIFRNKKVTKLEELKGMKMRGLPGFGAALMDAWGATGIAMPVADVYTALERGTIDGLITVPNFAIPAKINEVTKYWLWQPAMGGGNLIIMNKKVWESFPPDIQAIVEKLSKEAEVRYAKNQRSPAALKKILADIGWDVYELSPEESARWVKAGYPVVEKWMAENEAQGLPVRQAIGILRSLK